MIGSGFPKVHLAEGVTKALLNAYEGPREVATEANVQAFETGPGIVKASLGSPFPDLPNLTLDALIYEADTIPLGAEVVNLQPNATLLLVPQGPVEADTAIVTWPMEEFNANS
jgi:hypothetical protein